MMMMGFGIFGLFFMFLFFVVIIVAAVAIISWLFPRPLSTPTQTNSINRSSYRRASSMDITTNTEKEHETALDILKKRYVLGELTKEEFEMMKKDILQSH